MSTADEETIRRCRERLAEIDAQLDRLYRKRDTLMAEQDRLSLAIEAAKDPSVLNRRNRP